MMPMMVGPRQAGIQLVKVLYDLAGDDGPIPVWEPVERPRRAARTSSILHGGRASGGRARGGLCVGGRLGGAALMPPATSGARRGGCVRSPDTRWTISPATCSRWTRWLGPAGASKHYRATGKAGGAQRRAAHRVFARVRVLHPHLARDPRCAWLNAYAPGRCRCRRPARPPPTTARAADVRFHIKKHWVLEAQKLRARRP